MARVRTRRSKERLDTLTFYQRFQLRTGHPVGPADAFTDLAEMRDAWKRHGDQLTADYAAARPGHRPWGFWTFDHPRALEAPDAPQVYDPRRLHGFDWPAYLGAIRRSVAYLASHRLLFPGEEEAISMPRLRHDGRPHDWDAAALEGLRDAVGDGDD